MTSHTINRNIYLKEKKDRNELSAERAVHNRRKIMILQYRGQNSMISV